MPSAVLSSCCCSVTKLCPDLLCGPMDCSPLGSSVCGISQARILGRVVISFPTQGIFLTQGSNPHLLCLLHWQVDALSLNHQGSQWWDIVVQLLSHVQLWDPMNWSAPGFPVLHYLLEFAQTYVHWVDDAIQPFHSLLPPSPVLSLSQNQGLFQWVSSSHQVAKVLVLQLLYQSFWWIFRGVVVAHCFNLHFLNDMMRSISSYAICHL